METKDIKTAFNALPNTEKVEVLVELYYSLTDYYKDEFLRETENA